LARKRYSTTCPHCGGELASTVQSKPKAVDDEFAGRRVGFDAWNTLTFVVILVACIVAVVQVIYLYRNRPSAHRSDPVPMIVAPSGSQTDMATPLPPPVDGRPGGG